METIWLYQFCLIVAGDSIVGKLCLIRRFTEGRFAQVSDPTVGGGLFLPSGGERAGQKDQTSDLGHCGSGEVQVSLNCSVCLCVRL